MPDNSRFKQSAGAVFACVSHVLPEIQLGLPRCLSGGAIYSELISVHIIPPDEIWKRMANEHVLRRSIREGIPIGDKNDSGRQVHHAGRDGEECLHPSRACPFHWPVGPGGC